MLAWVRELANQADAEDPDALAHALTLLLDGGLSDGAVAGRLETAEVAASSARVLVGAALPRHA